jgi:hypothetical protein
MEPFLKRLAQALHDRHGTVLEKVAIVLPGKRAGLYLRKYLAQLSGTTIWSPTLQDVGGFMSNLAGMRQGGQLELLFMLYEAHCQLAGSGKEALADFLQWGPTTLRDMSEVDAHLLDLDKVYRDLKSYHEIEEWSFRLDRPSPGQERMMQQWRYTGALHRALEERMQQRGVGTSGAVARQAVERLGKGLAELPWSTIWFAGLNAVEPASTQVIKLLQAKGLATVAWDSDLHYLASPVQEAGAYLRRSIKDLGPGVLPPQDALRTRERRFVNVSVPNTMAQTTYAAGYLAQLTPEQRSTTAVVLADEGLLMPLLAALPGTIGPLNITMGMPLEALPVHGCTEAFIELHDQCMVQGAYRLADLERLLLHPFLNRPGASAKLIGLLRESRMDRPGYEQVLELAQRAGLEVGQAMRSALAPMTHAQQDMPERMAALVQWARQCIGNDAHRTEQLFQLARAQRRLDLGLARSGADVPDLRTYATLRKRLLHEERIAFFGEPLQGLQVMGFLETRAIDHERVLLLGASEGTLPRAGGQQSWIPSDIRRTYDLPLRSDAEAIAAYHFYRMAQYTRELVLVHSGGEGEGMAGPSRFILQWQHELAQHHSTSSSTVAYTSPYPARHAPMVCVAKDKAVTEALAALCQRGLSPSTLATWLRCPLDLYFTRLVGIRARDQVDGKLGSDVLGEAVHSVLEGIVRPHIGTVLQAEQLREAGLHVREALVARLAGSFPLHTLNKGNFRLRIDMASKALERHLLAEAEECRNRSTMPLAVELPLHAELRPGVNIKGRCDRVETRDGIVHVLDMKTGSVEARNLKVPGLEREHFTAERSQALQLLVYSWAYLVQHPEVELVRAGIVPIQKASRTEGLFLSVGSSNTIDRSMLPAIAELLLTLVGEMMDPAKPLVHSPDSKYCTACLPG